MLFTHVTSQVADEPYPNLLSEKGRNSFPSIAVLDATGELLAVHEGPRDIAGFEKTVAKAREFAPLLAKAAAGDKAARKQVLLTRVRWKAIAPDELRRQADELELSADEKAQIAAGLTDLELLHVRRLKDPNEALAMLRRIHDEGRVPASGTPQLMFWNYWLTHADALGDATEYRRAFIELEKLAADEPRYAKRLEDARKRLAELEKQNDRR